ncbi:hypothetical protein JIN84_13405 [Luteolibacter yonseiensis]|uniref:Peroxidase n=1 Tax=Luteolibacter yonseiensis TaxID=1144680 RepID=A0A934R5I1_9BACT|nr:peroxidase family protein [Luteolibacter yonseiensis]MBK1816616.1 hypothetical protein [Luteolibacter yonseiensis]
MSDSRYTKRKGFGERIIDGATVAIFRRINRWVEWHRLPGLLGVANLISFRIELRAHNLHDTDGDLTQPKKECPFHPGPNTTKMRTTGGTQNDMRFPAMGCRHSRLGRNMLPLSPVQVGSDLLEPNPLLVSKELLARKEFVPATSLNLLAAAWIQFQVHDWFNHEREAPGGGDPILVPREGDWESPTMLLRRTRPDPTNSDPLNARFPAFRNDDPQWWDASQIYGETDEEIRALRFDPDTGELCRNGRLYINAAGFLPVVTAEPGAPPAPLSGTTMSGFTDNWWLGLEILHTLFAKEHNEICDLLATAEPHLGQQEIFERARLINCAVMAKIHTVEWTPGILAHPAIKTALDANWMGLVGHWFGEGLARKIAGFLPDGVIKDVFTGVPLSETDHHGAPYALTEEFSSVYRLHPLIPDEVEIRNHRNGRVLGNYGMTEIAFGEARRPFRDGASMSDAIYSFGTSHPGAITINNYPGFLRALELPPDAEGAIEKLDLAAVDILRDRERGVPRYNEFRRQLRMKPIESWDELSGGRPALAAKLQTIYGELDKVDTMVGMFCEPLPKGFGFSDTAFRIFILMASRRLKSDRFFTTDYREEIYTGTGLEWIRKTGMKEVILRHHPELAPAFEGVGNPFAPWKSSGSES